MSDISDLILTLSPEDGSTIGNGAMLALLRDHMPELAEDDYIAARDALIDEGVLGRGKGRGGSIFRVTDDLGDEDDDLDEDEGDEDDGFELTHTEEAAPRKPRAKAGKKVARRPDGPVQVLSYRHGETRVNNPEVGMVHAGTDPDGDKTVWAYDPHLDPVLNFDSARAGIEKLIDDALASGDPERMKDALQELKRLQAPYLNWTGKAERTSVAVDTVSLHVHERVDPATILANAARRLKGKEPATQWRQPDLFAAPFENLPLRQALDFYHHEKGWSNRLVAGDSLLVMNSLLTKESMGGKVQMIYIDPPYGIKYGSNFQPFTNKRDVKDRSDADLTQEPEMIKAFRDTWELGIHSYLTYLRDRLVLARELLTESGSVFVQIGDENIHRVRAILEEIFGETNYVTTIDYVTTSGRQDKFVDTITNHIVCFAKDISKLKYRQLYLIRPDYSADFIADQLQSDGVRADGDYDIVCQGRTFNPKEGNHWKIKRQGAVRLGKCDRLVPQSSMIRYKRFSSDFPVKSLSNVWTDTSGGAGADKVYVVQSTERIVERCLLMTTDPGDLVLDPTCGSGTTAFVAEKWGRRWITCDTSRVAITLAKQRLMTASFDYYALRYSQEGLGGGFDYETVPHITLKSIANNPDIDTIHDEDHPKVTAALESLNAALAKAPPKPLKPAQGVRKGKPVDFAKGEPPRVYRRVKHSKDEPYDKADIHPRLSG